MPRDETLTTKRFRRLLQQIRDEWQFEHGNDHGWIQAVADRTGLNRSMISAIWNGTKGAGSRSAEKAMATYTLPSGYFLDANLDPEQFFAPPGSHLSERPPESHVEPVDEHQHIARARTSGHYPDWVLAAAKGFFHNRDGQYSYGELVDWMDRVSAEGEAAFSQKTSRIGPPKRGA